MNPTGLQKKDFCYCSLYCENGEILEVPCTNLRAPRQWFVRHTRVTAYGTETLSVDTSCVCL